MIGNKNDLFSKQGFNKGLFGYKMLANKKINLIHVVDRLEIGGMENGVVNICNRLDQSQFNPMICCLNGEGAMTKRLHNNVKIYNLMFNGKISPFNLKKVASVFRRQRVDIVHTHGWGGGSFEGILAAKIAGVPIIINGEHGSFFEKWYQLIIQKILFKICNANLAVSSSLREQLVIKYRFSKDKIKVIENGVDLEKFSGRFSRRSVIEKLKREGFHVKSDLLTIISVGTLKPEKNQKLLLDALNIINQDMHGIPVQILFVGDGQDRRILTDVVRNYSLTEKVFFLGNRTDIPELLSLSDILVSTSITRHEGMSNVMLEAFASGVPVIATKSVGASELVQDGYNGFLIEVNNKRKLSKSFRLLYEHPDLLLRLRKNARETAIKSYSIEVMIKKYQDLYFKLILSSKIRLSYCINAL